MHALFRARHIKIFYLLDIKILYFLNTDYINGLVHDCSIFIGNALEILQSCTKPFMYDLEENFAQIHLRYWQFYLSWAVGQWDMSSSDFGFLFIWFQPFIQIALNKILRPCPQALGPDSI